MKHAWIFVIAASLGLASMSPGEEGHCFPTGNCYMIHTIKLPFEKANVTCGRGGYLTTMKNEQEKEEILQVVTEYHNKKNISTFWIGLFQPKNTCTVMHQKLYGFSWISGDQDTQINEWKKPLQQSCTRIKRCVALQSRGASTASGLERNVTWFWKNYKCSKNFTSICRHGDYLDIIQHEELTSLPTKDPSTHQHTEMTYSNATINVLCKGFRGNVTITCTVLNVSYSCNNTHCFCGHTNDEGGGLSLRRCQESRNTSCLDQCVNSSNIPCACTDTHYPCDREECTITSSPLFPISTRTVQHGPNSTSLVVVTDGVSLVDEFIIPLILGLVALGILIMLVWGGVQMCVRKKKPKRKKSIAPVEPEASDTDSTDHSSSDEGESQDRIEMP